MKFSGITITTVIIGTGSRQQAAGSVVNKQQAAGMFRVLGGVLVFRNIIITNRM
jgi:hypothetical protein